MTTPSRVGSPTYVVVDASAGNGTTSVTVPSGCNCITAKGGDWDNNGNSTLSALSFDGDAFSFDAQIAEGATTDENGVFAAHLVNPTIGSATLSWTWSGGGARAEGGEILLTFWQDVNAADPVRDAGVDSASSTTNVSVTISSASTDAVDVYAESYTSGGPPVITSATATYLNNSSLNSHVFDGGEVAPGASSVTVQMTGEYYSAMAAMSLKESTGGTDNLLADDIESASEVTSPSVGQEHALTADDIESASEVTTPTLTEVNALLANSLESASELTTPTIGQVHALTQPGIQSASELTLPTISQVHALLADDVQSQSELTLPVLGEPGSGTTLLILRPRIGAFFRGVLRR